MIIKIDVKDVERSLGVLANQVPFAASRALNDTMVQSQQKQLESMAKRFQIRRPVFAKMSNKIKFSDKKNLTASLSIASMPGSRDTTDVLGKFEEGGTKRPKGNSLAIPLPNVRPNKSRIIPAAKRPNNLKGAFKMKSKRGNLLLVQATGKGKRRKIKPLYLLKKSVAIDPQLHFEATVTRAVNEHFTTNLNKRLAEALGTAKL